ncbi:hypothetical protein CP969_01525 [Streptomyces viridosporus T7A]|uniref:Uncharacterized protein n=1 Tax=Streptomyces viridosporus T7A TaxID=665577 RepID=A0ABX6A8A5_STRVD|nr:hypothetical protein CP969_01525 [Streptomyces viridosporus T7A]
MTTRCPFSDPEDPVSRVSKIKSQGLRQHTPRVRAPTTAGREVLRRSVARQRTDGNGGRAGREEPGHVSPRPPAGPRCLGAAVPCPSCRPRSRGVPEPRRAVRAA